jgi:hypothetical protein
LTLEHAAASLSPFRGKSMSRELISMFGPTRAGGELDSLENKFAEFHRKKLNDIADLTGRIVVSGRHSSVLRLCLVKSNRTLDSYL